MQPLVLRYVTLCHGGVPWVVMGRSHTSPMDINTNPDLLRLVNLALCQKPTPPQPWRKDEKYLYFSSCFPRSMCAVFCSTHRMRKRQKLIVFVQEGIPSCTKTILPVTQDPLQHSARGPALAMLQGGLRWRLAATNAPALREGWIVPYLSRYGAIQLSPFDIMQRSTASSLLRCVMSNVSNYAPRSLAELNLEERVSIGAYQRAIIIEAE